jgi:hypothetical protein
MVNRLIHKITTTKDPVIRQVYRKTKKILLKFSIILRFVKHMEMFLLRMLLFQH